MLSLCKQSKLKSFLPQIKMTLHGSYEPAASFFRSQNAVN